MTDPRFSYHERKTCICGAALAPDGEYVKKDTAWGEVGFMRCRRCGSWAQSPQIDTQSLAGWYDSREYVSARDEGEGVYLNYLDEEKQRKAEAASRYRVDIAPFLPAGANVLEIGCATASLLAVIRDEGHRITGIDLSGQFTRMARELNGIDVIVDDFLNYSGQSREFDMIIMLGTVSNLQDLTASLDKAKRMLKPGGRIFLNFPAADSLVARLYGKRFWMFTPSVSAFMTKPGCAMALAASGFDIEKMKMDWQSPSLSKLLGHARLGFLFPLLQRLGLDKSGFSFSIPIPVVYNVMAVKKE